MPLILRNNLFDEILVPDARNSTGFLWFLASAPVRMQVKQSHHPPYPLFVGVQMQRQPPVSVGWMIAPCLLDSDFQCTIFFRELSLVIQGGDRDAKLFGERHLSLANLSDQLFFWDSESLSVTSPTNSSNALFSRLSLANSIHDGALLAPAPSQP